MSKKAWIVAIVVAVVFAGGGFWGGMSYAAIKRPSFGDSGAASFGARSGVGGAALVTHGGAGATVGTIIQAGNGSITVQLPNSTSTDAQTGTKLVLVSNSTQVSEMESVPVSSLKVGDTVAVSGAANSDGSVTASSVQILPSGARFQGGGSTSAAPMIPANQ